MCFIGATSASEREREYSRNPHPRTMRALLTCVSVLCLCVSVCYACCRCVCRYADQYNSVDGEAAMMAELFARGPISCGVDASVIENYTGGYVQMAQCTCTCWRLVAAW